MCNNPLQGVHGQLLANWPVLHPFITWVHSRTKEAQAIKLRHDKYKSFVGTKRMSGGGNNTKEESSFIEQQGGYESTRPDDSYHVQEFVVPEYGLIEFAIPKSGSQTFAGSTHFQLDHLNTFDLGKNFNLFAQYAYYRLVKVKHTMWFDYQIAENVTDPLNYPAIFAIAPWSIATQSASTTSAIPHLTFVGNSEWRICPIHSSRQFDVRAASSGGTLHWANAGDGPGTQPLQTCSFITVENTNPKVGNPISRFSGGVAQQDGQTANNEWLLLSSPRGFDDSRWQTFVYQHYFHNLGTGEGNYTIQFRRCVIKKYTIAFKGRYWLVRNIVGFAESKEVGDDDANVGGESDGNVSDDRRERQHRKCDGECSMLQQRMHTERTLSRLSGILEGLQSLVSGDRPTDELDKAAPVAEIQDTRGSKAALFELSEEEGGHESDQGSTGYETTGTEFADGNTTPHPKRRKKA